MRVTPLRVWLLTIVVTAAGVVAFAALDQRSSRQAAFNRVPGGVPVNGVPLARGITVRDQLEVRDLPAIAATGIRTVIDLRPDGEGFGQPPSRVMEAAATRAGMAFIYLPAPVDRIPDEIADRLARYLATAESGVLLYCGSGWRAARVWALAEAARAGGADAATIMQAVRDARHDIDDLRPRIEARIASRKGTL